MESFLKEIVREAGSISLSYFRTGVERSFKAHLADIVTKADLEVNQFLIKKIKERYPDHSIYSEEEKEVINPGGPYIWMIDPIDGTRNFAGGIPMWSVMIAVWSGEEIVLAAIYNPVVNEMFFAEKGKGASLNGVPLKVNGVDSLEHASSFVIRGIKTPHSERYNRMMDRLTNETNIWMHNYGGIGLGMCYLASGAIDFLAVNCGFDHDFAPGVLICSEAGAKVTDSEGKPWQRGRVDLVVANPNLHDKVLGLLR